MKTIQTSKVHAYEQWRINNIDKYGSFIWPQLNYTTPNCDILNIIFEEKPNINNSLSDFIRDYIPKTLTYNIINLTDHSSKYYITTSSLKTKLNLKLSNEYSGSVSSYWDYRLKTRPCNCITADIDSIELTEKYPVGIEAAQLFVTENISESIKHIFNTFTYRTNKVNPFQYIIQQKFMEKIGGKAFILFHKIENKLLVDNKPILLLENNEDFTNILKDIRDNSLSLNSFLCKHQQFFQNNIKSFDNISEGYKFIKKK